jgi:hypothetical protein
MWKIELSYVLPKRGDNFYQTTRHHILKDMIFNDKMESVEGSSCFFRHSVQELAYQSEGNEKFIELK